MNGRAVAMGLISLAILACRESSAPSPLAPQTSGTIEIDGVSAPVRVVRDRYGVPHIYAQSRDDLFAAQGFVQAQDRLFQMDLWRRSVQGRLSEVLGPNFIERDAMTRRMQFRGDLDAEWASYGPDAHAIAAAFVRGINGWVALARERPPAAFVVAGWKPSFWSVGDLLNRTDAFIASGDAVDEVRRRHLDDVIVESLQRVGAPPFFAGLGGDVPGTPPPERRPGRAVTRDPVIRLASETTSTRSGSHASATRDGHLLFDEAASLASPAARYLVHLHAPGWNVIGATAPWRPGVAEGHNERIAWSAVPIDVDTQDIVIVDGAAGPRRIAKDAIVVKGRRVPFVFETEYVDGGVVIASDREHNRVFTLRWSGLEIGAAPELAALLVDVAGDFPAFQTALQRWKMPPRRVVYADTAGNIGYQDAALVPARGGRGPQSESAWVGWTATDALPHAFNPRGVEVSQAARAGVSVASEANFAHALSISVAAHRYFGVGPIQRPAGDDQPFRMVLETSAWDRSRALNAPGQSENHGAHFNDAATLWSAGETFPLAFTESAVNANAEATLMLIPRRRP